jgi:hypothetical protein
MKTTIVETSNVRRNICVCYLLQWNWQTILIGVSFLAFLLVAKYIVRQYITCSKMERTLLGVLLTIFDHAVSLNNSGKKE